MSDSIKDKEIIKEHLRNGAKIWHWYLSGGTGLFPKGEENKCYSIPVELFYKLRKENFINTDCKKHLDCIVFHGKYQEYKIKGE